MTRTVHGRTLVVTLDVSAQCMDERCLVSSLQLRPVIVEAPSGDSVVYRNFEGVIGRYDDVPRKPHQCVDCEDRESANERGIARLLNRTADRFEPTAVRDTPTAIKIKQRE